ncbi:tripartite tricarboxylate transporter permease [Pararhizobium mangrovi]|uniref:Tripartite tricarboxylate transporter permease n=1 Tax=Pararhizobium mangrovi TaxID=2590452 RepID=A0A506UD70_9HYPH|nr:tripartite tricarboxylate transporter permease [Pararhizobium mangrovi]TPW31880.1 tripartite tricarboxylate transporter permease [Pararhizobium mangrovi]
MELLNHLAVGASVALTWNGLFYCFIGVTLGMFVGVLPGVGPLPAIAMLLPVTFYLDPIQAMIMLSGVYYGGQYGGKTASILLNLPGTAPAAVTCLDGYPMAKQGRADIALFVTTISSFVGSLLGIILVGGFAPLLAKFALSFGAAEYFSLVVLALIGASAMGGSSFARSLSMVFFGLLLGIVGEDVTSGRERFTFGIPQIADRLDLVAVAMGLFGVAEVISTARKSRVHAAEGFSYKVRLPSREDMRRTWKPTLRGAGMGAICGILPGAGATMASFLAYAVERWVSKTPEKFGTGMIEGVTAPEAADNAAAQSSFIPTLTLGIPGSAVMAVMLGALMIHGITPTPRLITDNAELFWGLVVSFLLGNAILLVFNIPMIGIWVRLLQIPYTILYPIILAFICIGVYSINSSVFDIYLVLLFGLMGYGMRLLHLPPAPLILGFILSPMLEQNFRRAMLLSRGSFEVFVERPISAAFLAASALIVLAVLAATVRRALRNRKSIRKPVEV